MNWRKKNFANNNYWKASIKLKKKILNYLFKDYTLRIEIVVERITLEHWVWKAFIRSKNKNVVLYSYRPNSISNRNGQTKWHTKSKYSHNIITTNRSKRQKSIMNVEWFFNWCLKSKTKFKMRDLLTCVSYDTIQMLHSNKHAILIVFYSQFEMIVKWIPVQHKSTIIDFILITTIVTQIIGSNRMINSVWCAHVKSEHHFEIESSIRNCMLPLQVILLFHCFHDSIFWNVYLDKYRQTQHILVTLLLISELYLEFLVQAQCIWQSFVWSIFYTPTYLWVYFSLLIIKF